MAKVLTQKPTKETPAEFRTRKPTVASKIRFGVDQTGGGGDAPLPDSGQQTFDSTFDFTFQ